MPEIVHGRGRRSCPGIHHVVSAFASFLQQTFLPRQAEERRAALMIQKNYRRHSVRVKFFAVKRAAVHVQAWARARAAIAEAKKRRHAQRVLHRWVRRRQRRRAATKEAALAKNRGIKAFVANAGRKLAGTRLPSPWTGILAMVLTIVMVSVAVSSRTCLRWDALWPGDRVPTRGQCIEGKTGSRFFGWLPGVAWKPRLSVSEDGEMHATLSDTTRVALGGGAGSGMGGKGGIFCRLERLVLGKGYFCSVFAAPDLEKPLRCGGHAHFAENRDLEVINSVGGMLWSFAQHLDGEGRRGIENVVSRNTSQASRLK